MPTIGKPTAIYLGADAPLANPVTLTCHDWIADGNIGAIVSKRQAVNTAFTEDNAVDPRGATIVLAKVNLHGLFRKKRQP